MADDDRDMTLVMTTIEVAETQIGVHEVTANWSPEIKAYLKAAGLTDPEPWCAAFANWCAEQAAAKLGVVSPLERVPYQGSVQSYVDYGKAHGWVIPTAAAQPGDLVCVWHKSLNRYGHVGLVTGWQDGVLTTIEGNSNNDGSREGVAVVRHTRTPSPNLLILRWA